MISPGFTAEFSLQKCHHAIPRQMVVSRHEEAGVVTGRGVKMAAGVPVYGNWCGPGHGGESGPPIDPVDQVCCRHDKCYDQRGYLDCSCNQDLLDAMPGAILNPMTPPDGKIAGEAIIAVFAGMPCACWANVCLPFVGCFNVPAPGLFLPGFCPPPFA
jgi:hypothetical protein